MAKIKISLTVKIVKTILKGAKNCCYLSNNSHYTFTDFCWYSCCNIWLAILTIIPDYISSENWVDYWLRKPAVQNLDYRKVKNEISIAVIPLSVAERSIPQSNCRRRPLLPFRLPLPKNIVDHKMWNQESS